MDNVFEPDLQEAVKGRTIRTVGSGMTECLATTTPSRWNWAAARVNTPWGWPQMAQPISSAWTSRGIASGEDPANQDGLSNVAFLRRIEFIDQFFGQARWRTLLTFSDPRPRTRRAPSASLPESSSSAIASFWPQAAGEVKSDSKLLYALSEDYQAAGYPFLRFGRRLRGFPDTVDADLRERWRSRRTTSSAGWRRQEHPLHGNRSSGAEGHPRRPLV